MPAHRIHYGCAFQGCARPHSAKGLCAPHYYQQKRRGHLTPIKTIKAQGTGCIDKKGYKRIPLEGREPFEHRVIMERHLDRKLASGETVHHKNGVRHDNALSNLELRVGAHPKGMSVGEAVAWARATLERYT